MSGQTKWRIGDDVLSDEHLFDTSAAALESRGWQQRDGMWLEEGEDDPTTQKVAMAVEEIQEVRQFQIGTSGTVRVSYETTVWATDQKQTLGAATELPDLLSGSSFEQTEPPDANDFDPWAKVAAETEVSSNGN